MGLDSNFPRTAGASGYIYDPLHYLENVAPDDALFIAIEKNDPLAISHLADRSMVNLSTVNDQGQNPLHLAIELGKDDALTALLVTLSGDHSNAINEPNRFGYTPLMLATEKGKLSLAKSLIALGATINSDPNANCSASQLAQRKQTIAHAQLLLDTKGNATEAVTLALKRKILSFLKVVVTPEQNAALMRAVGNADIDEARALIKSGVDASLVLMLAASQKQPGHAADHGANLLGLVSLGANLSTALEYALAANAALAIVSLMLMGADGDAALEWSVQNNDVTATAFLFAQGVSGDKLLIDHAMHGNADAVKFLIATEMPTAKIVVGLAKNGDKDAVDLLIAAGAPRAEEISELAEFGGLLHANGITQLSDLIAAGVDTSKILFDLVKDNDLHTAKILLAAGADASAALKHESKSQLKDTQKTLTLISQELSAVQNLVKRLDENEHANITVVEKILSAQKYMAQPDMHLTREFMQDIANRAASDGEINDAKLLLALESVDWESIKKLCVDEEAASMALQHSVVFNNLFAVRLLTEAGTSVNDFAMHLMQKGDVKGLFLLMEAGMPVDWTFASIFNNDLNKLAKEIFETDNFDKLEAMKSVSESYGSQQLRKFIPAITDGAAELVEACVNRDISFAKTLIAEGANVDEALICALMDDEPIVARQLMALGAKKHEAVVSVLENEQQPLDQMLFAAGASPYIAVEHAHETGQIKAIARLDAMGYRLPYPTK